MTHPVIMLLCGDPALHKALANPINTAYALILLQRIDWYVRNAAWVSCKNAITLYSDRL